MMQNWHTLLIEIINSSLICGIAGWFIVHRVIPGVKLKIMHREQETIAIQTEIDTLYEAITQGTHTIQTQKIKAQRLLFHIEQWDAFLTQHALITETSQKEHFVRLRERKEQYARERAERIAAHSACKEAVRRARIVLQEQFRQPAKQDAYINQLCSDMALEEPR